jgi:hypothetical protein
MVMTVKNKWNFMIKMVKVESLKTTLNISIVSSSTASEYNNKSKNYPQIVDHLSKPITIHDIGFIEVND